MRRVICIIQARMGSTRLPQKILLPLAGKSMLQNVVERVQRAKLVDEVIVACPMRDLTQIKRVSSCSVFATTIDDNDLIGRYLSCAAKDGADYIIRICADSPCVEPEFIDDLVDAGHCFAVWGLLMNSENPYLDHDGFGGEFYSIEMLEWMDRVIKEPEYREHPHKFWIKVGAFDYCGKSYPRGFRLDVNTQEEYLKLKDIYDHFDRNDFTVEEVMEYLSKKGQTNVVL